MHLCEIHAIPATVKLVHVLVHVRHIKLQYVSLGAKQLTHVRHCSSQVSMDELFDVCACRSEHMQLKEMLI